VVIPRGGWNGGATYQIASSERFVTIFGQSTASAINAGPSKGVKADAIVRLIGRQACGMTAYTYCCPRRLGSASLGPCSRSAPHQLRQPDEDSSRKTHLWNAIGGVTVLRAVFGLK
jgi:hypothetical protein